MVSAVAGTTDVESIQSSANDRHGK